MFLSNILTVSRLLFTLVALHFLHFFVFLPPFALLLSLFLFLLNALAGSQQAAESQCVGEEEEEVEVERRREY